MQNTSNESIRMSAVETHAGAREYADRLPAYSPARCVLTAREVEVLRLLADGLTTRALAIQLKVTFKTAACHRARILQKLAVSSTVLAVRWAIRESIVAP
jgi:DNA-binding NarL/FixJ family response regulator